MNKCFMCRVQREKPLLIQCVWCAIVSQYYIYKEGIPPPMPEIDWNKCKGRMVSANVIYLLEEFIAHGCGAPSECDGSIECFYCGAFVEVNEQHDKECVWMRSKNLLEGKGYEHKRSETAFRTQKGTAGGLQEESTGDEKEDKKPKEEGEESGEGSSDNPDSSPTDTEGA